MIIKKRDLNKCFHIMLNIGLITAGLFGFYIGSLSLGSPLLSHAGFGLVIIIAFFTIIGFLIGAVIGIFLIPICFLVELREKRYNDNFENILKHLRVDK